MVRVEDRMLQRAACVLVLQVVLDPSDELLLVRGKVRGGDSHSCMLLSRAGHCWVAQRLRRECRARPEEGCSRQCHSSKPVRGWNLERDPTIQCVTSWGQLVLT
jgi:hypothetical protein